MVKNIGNRFEIDDLDNSVLGVGGMGTVYRGIDTQTEATVAIKELKLEVMHATPDVLERFEREADALRMLNHPNIVKVLASFADGNHHYIVMEYVTGGSLRDIMQTTPQLPIERVLEISLDLADALTRAHRLKIIHRDIKPANVLLAEDGTPRLTDFGVARIDDKSRMTETGMVVGTLSYLSPETLDGQKPNERQDIWAFGVMLYEMLAGSRPFEGDTASAVITSILTKPAPDILELRADAPTGLNRLIQSMLEKDPAYRIDSIRKVGTELENIIRGVDSDEYDIDTDLLQAVKEADKSRFDSDSDQTATVPFTLTAPSTKYGIPQHTGVKIMQDESGEDLIVLPARIAMKGRKAIVGTVAVLLLVIVGLIIALTDGDDEGENLDNAAVVPLATPAVNWLDDIPIIADDEFLVVLISHSALTPDHAMYNAVQDSFLDVTERFQREIPFSNIKVHSASVTASTMNDATQLFLETSADVMVWAEVDGDTVDYRIQGGNPNRNVGLFDSNEVMQLTAVEVVITEEDQTIAPYILGALDIVHTMNGNIFEFMRTLAILEEIDEPPAILESGGTSEHYFSFFNHYLDDTPVAIEAITRAIDLDGGNPVWYAMRGSAYMRLNDAEQSIRDARTAKRIGPDGWSIPLIIEATTFYDLYDSRISLLDEALEAHDDWFVYYLRSTFYYAIDDLELAWADVIKSIENNPQANYPYISGFLIAIREGRAKDAGRMMAQLIEHVPNPTLGNRVYRAAFGDNNIGVILSGMLYEGFGNVILGQYEPVAAFAPELLELFTQFNDEFSSFDLDTITTGERYFSGDVMMMIGMSYCALEDYTTSSIWLSQGIQVDPTNPMLHFLQAEVAFRQGQQDVASAELDQIRGLNDEFDAVIEAGQNQEVSCGDFFDYFVELGNTSISDE